MKEEPFVPARSQYVVDRERDGPDHVIVWPLVVSISGGGGQFGWRQRCRRRRRRGRGWNRGVVVILHAVDADLDGILIFSTFVC